MQAAASWSAICLFIGYHFAPKLLLPLDRTFPISEFVFSLTLPVFLDIICADTFISLFRHRISVFNFAAEMNIAFLGRQFGLL